MAETVASIAALTRAAATTATAYRGRLLAGLLTTFFPLLLMAVWLTVVATSGPPRGWTAPDFISYYAAASLLWHLSGQNVIWQWDEDIRGGDFSIRLLRPVHPFWQYAANDLGQRLVMLGLAAPVFVAATLVLPQLGYHLTAVRLLATVVAVLLAYAVSITMASLVALLGFWSTQTTNLWMLWWGLGSFASGWIAPLEVMPGWLRSTAEWLPFRTTMGFPVELMTGRLSAAETAFGFAVGLGWLALFTVLYLVVWKPGVRRHQAVGG
ncbi:ABC-2 family transporter protein [Micromonospora sp. NPDC049645]|uniref:ABC transporter permease n=1 Tax=Micromonospora sp. NPDC049645 TaxID=3155508 RepID=UPI0034477062